MENEEDKELTLEEKIDKIKKYYGLEDNTIQYFRFYKFGDALISKLYEKAK